MGSVSEFMKKFLGHSTKQQKVIMKCEVYTLLEIHTHCGCCPDICIITAERHGLFWTPSPKSQRAPIHYTFLYYICLERKTFTF